MFLCSPTQLCHAQVHQDPDRVPVDSTEDLVEQPGERDGDITDRGNHKEDDTR